jgi:hypothetical protein
VGAIALHDYMGGETTKGNGQTNFIYAAARPSPSFYQSIVALNYSGEEEIYAWIWKLIHTATMSRLTNAK